MFGLAHISSTQARVALDGEGLESTGPVAQVPIRLGGLLLKIVPTVDLFCVLFAADIPTRHGKLLSICYFS